MELVWDRDTQPISPDWVTLPLLPAYQINSQRRVRNAKSEDLVPEHEAGGRRRVRLFDVVSGRYRYYDLDFLWGLSKAEAKEDLFALELKIRPGAVHERLLAQTLSLYSDPAEVEKLSPRDRLYFLKFIASMRSPVSGASSVKAPTSIENMRRYAAKLEGATDDDG